MGVLCCARVHMQWAATLTQSGANLPFVAPLKADKLPTGFQISMLRRSDKTRSFGSIGDVVATVEEQEGVVSSSSSTMWGRLAGWLAVHSQRWLQQ